MPFPNPETQFKPNNPGGPGRPKRKILTAILAEVLEANDSADARAVIEALLRGAKKGRIEHIKVVLDRAEGRVGDVEETGHKGSVERLLDDGGDTPDPDPTPASP